MLSYEAIQSFVFQEARALDERRWNDWLEFYAEDVEFWMPSWDDDDTLTNDPAQRSLADLLRQPSGLEDRIFRIETERSSATIPDTRHAKSITNLEVLCPGREQRQAAFQLDHQQLPHDILDTYFGYSEYTPSTSGPKPVIKKKYVVLKNDYIHHVLDIYHI